MTDRSLAPVPSDRFDEEVTLTIPASVVAGAEPATHARPEAGVRVEDDTVVVPPLTGETAVLAAVQSRLANEPVVKVAHGLSLFGEHALGWLAIGAVGAVVDRRRRGEWVTAAAGVAFAHGASIGIKRVVRRPRPDHAGVAVLVGTPSRLSFPSSHATSTTAAAVLYGRLLDRRLVRLLVPPMALSRLVLGVHYPSDVAAGSLLGGLVGVVVGRVSRRRAAR